MSSTPVGFRAVGDGGNQQAQNVVGSHVISIQDYSRRKAVDNNHYYISEVFNVGGHAWRVAYFPQGDATSTTDWISLHLVPFHTPLKAQLKVHLAFSLLANTGEPALPHTMARDITFTDSGSDVMSGFPCFMERKALEESPYLVDDCFRVRCVVTVKNICGAQATGHLVAVPPSDMNRHIGGLLSSREGVDVTFEVDGETFCAHRLVLAARSSVFKAEFFGQMKEKNMSHIRIDDVEASVFKAMLHFIYNDTLPAIDRDDMPAMAQHLLVAADRYGLDRLKSICEHMLCCNINTSTLATTLAEQHGCHGLKDACFVFLKTTKNLKAVMASESYQHLIDSFPSFLAELAAKLSL